MDRESIRSYAQYLNSPQFLHTTNCIHIYMLCLFISCFRKRFTISDRDMLSALGGQQSTMHWHQRQSCKHTKTFLHSFNVLYNRLALELLSTCVRRTFLYSSLFCLLFFFLIFNSIFVFARDATLTAHGDIDTSYWCTIFIYICSAANNEYIYVCAWACTMCHLSKVHLKCNI